jgi:hypothetical protein
VRKYCIPMNTSTEGVGVIVRYNLAVRCSQFMQLNGTTGPAAEKNFECYNNTVVDPGDYFADGTYYPAGLNNDYQANVATWYNNIVAFLSAPDDQVYHVNLGGSEPSPTATFDTTTYTTFDYNCYYQVSGTQRWVTNGITYNTFAAWEAAVQADVAGQEDNSITSNPSFTNAGADDYTLAGGSPCLATGQGGVNMGCYLTGSEEIGVESA